MVLRMLSNNLKEKEKTLDVPASTLLGKVQEKVSDLITTPISLISR